MPNQETVAAYRQQYKDMYQTYMEDGSISTEEQKSLDELDALIEQAETKFGVADTTGNKGVKIGFVPPADEGAPRHTRGGATRMTGEDIDTTGMNVKSGEKDSTGNKENKVDFVPPADNGAPTRGVRGAGTRVVEEDIDTTGMNVKSGEQEERTKVGNTSDAGTKGLGGIVKNSTSGRVTNHSDRNWWVSGAGNDGPGDFVSLPPGGDTDKIATIRDNWGKDVDAVWPNGMTLNFYEGNVCRSVTSGAFKLSNLRHVDICGNATEGYFIQDFSEYIPDSGLGAHGFSFAG